MAESTIIKTKRDGKITLYDYSDAHSLEVAFEAGDFELTIPGATVEMFLDRGRIGSTPSIRYGDDQPMSGKFTANLRDVSDASYATLAEILAWMAAGGAGAAGPGAVGSSWVSRLGSTGEVRCLKIIWTIEGNDHGDSGDHTITLDYVTFSGSLGEGMPNTISLDFQSFQVYPTLA